VLASDNFPLGLLFYLEGGGDMFLRIIGLSPKVSLLTASAGILLELIFYPEDDRKIFP
jgi:hypothetical protein